MVLVAWRIKVHGNIYIKLIKAPMNPTNLLLAKPCTSKGNSVQKINNSTE